MHDRATVPTALTQSEPRSSAHVHADPAGRGFTAPHRPRGRSRWVDREHENRRPLQKCWLRRAGVKGGVHSSWWIKGRHCTMRRARLRARKGRHNRSSRASNRYGRHELWQPAVASAAVTGGRCEAARSARRHHRQAGCRHQDRPHPRRHHVLTCRLAQPCLTSLLPPACPARQPWAEHAACVATGGAMGLPSVVLGVRPGGAAAACVAVGERLLAINGEPVTDHEAASQLLREATGEVVPPHGHSTLAARPQLPSSPCDLSSAPAPPRGAPGGSGRPKAPGREQRPGLQGPRAPGQGSRPQGESRGQGSRPQGERRLAAGRRHCLGCSSLPTRRSPPGTAHCTRRCGERAHCRGEHAP